MPLIKTVPNQRVIKIHKEICDRNNKYTMNNLSALDEAANRLQTKGGFKLYMYLAKNQENYSFALSSADFCLWSGLGITAYRSAFYELVDNGYLISKQEESNTYIFYDKSQRNPEKDIDNVIIEIPKEKHIEINLNKRFRF